MCLSQTQPQFTLLVRFQLRLPPSIWVNRSDLHLAQFVLHLNCWVFVFAQIRGQVYLEATKRGPVQMDLVRSVLGTMKIQ